MYMGSDDYEGVSRVVRGYKLENDVEDIFSGTQKSVRIYYFKDKESANAAWDKFKEENGHFEVCKKFGKMLWAGTKDAVNAAK